MSYAMINQITDSNILESNWKSLYRIGDAAALATVFVGVVEIGITYNIFL